ncbi:OadG family transporter subunit [Porphyromonas pogonae]|uniref:OadG family transporter subunit n=1 Tax=Porphyromonas pogonae TaxID=867595 RepID=UPI002E7A37B7|nr:OadG family transporter subunit [Porphyromonas pogonae]
MKITGRKLSALMLSLAIGSLSAPLWGQKATSLRLNEVLVSNETNFIDDYGNRHPWIEIYNSSAASVDMKGCYLTDDISNLKKYMVPKGDVLTLIKPYQHILFWADNDAIKGTFHLNFTLDPNKPNFIALIDADGKTIIDSITVPAQIPPDISYGRILDGAGGIGNKSAWANMTKVTPSTNNVTLDSNEKIDRLKREDRSGGIMALTAILVVFLGLIILALVFKYIGKASISASQKRKSKEEAWSDGTNTQVTVSSESVPDDVYAAIALALYEEMGDTHDQESYTLTFNRSHRTASSAWNNKALTMRQQIIKKQSR